MPKGQAAWVQRQEWSLLARGPRVPGSLPAAAFTVQAFPLSPHDRPVSTGTMETAAGLVGPEALLFP